MITVVTKPGRTPARLLDYLSSSRRTGASLLLTNLVGNSVAEWSIEIEAVARQRPRGEKRFVRHFVLSFAPEDRLDRSELEAISRTYLERMGYGEAPVVGFLHEDKAHRHVHLVTTATNFEGKAISDSHDWRRSMRAAREIERVWGLRVVENPRDLPRERPPRRGEAQALVRREERPARQAFQNELAELALRSSHLLEAVERWQARGFEVSARLDAKTRELVGLSFAREGFAFSGAQLGRDFRGNRFLDAFGLRFEPEREAEALARQLERGRAGAGRPELEARSPARRAAASSAQPELPEGSYQAAAVPLAVLVDPRRHIDREALRGLESPPDRRELARTADELARRHPASAVLVRPSDLTRWVGLRDVSAQGLARLERAGAEPSWTLAVGRGLFDVLFELAGRLSEPEQRALRRALAREAEAPPASGFFVDGVRMPGSRVDPESLETARLVAVRGVPISAEARWVERVRAELERGEVLRGIENRPQPGSLHGAPDVLKQEAAIRWLEERELGRSAPEEARPAELRAGPVLAEAHAQLEAARDRVQALAERAHAGGGEAVAAARAALEALTPLEEAARAASAELARRLEHDARLDREAWAKASEAEPATRQAAVRAAIAGELGEALAAFLRYREDLARRASHEALFVCVASSAEERLPLALARVRHVSPTPEALRELAGALVALEGAQAVHLAPPVGSEPRAWITRLLHLERVIAHQAERLLELGPAAPRELRTRLLTQATEAVGLHQALDRLLRSARGLVDPAPAPEGVSREAWQLAWMRRAVETGHLACELAASHVANAHPSPAVSASVAAHALAIAAPAARQALGVAVSWADRVRVRER